jgi:hypothetical protein
VVFSGDVHFGSVVNGLLAHGRDQNTIRAGRGDWSLRIAQVTSSPIKNHKAEAFEEGILPDWLVKLALSQLAATGAGMPVSTIAMPNPDAATLGEILLRNREGISAVAKAGTSAGVFAAIGIAVPILGAPGAIWGATRAQDARRGAKKFSELSDPYLPASTKDQRALLLRMGEKDLTGTVAHRTLVHEPHICVVDFPERGGPQRLDVLFLAAKQDGSAVSLKTAATALDLESRPASIQEGDDVFNAPAPITRGSSAA